MKYCSGLEPDRIGVLKKLGQSLYQGRVGALGVGASKNQGWSLEKERVGASKKSKLVLGNRLEPGRLKSWCPQTSLYSNFCKRGLVSSLVYNKILIIYFSYYNYEES